MARNTTGIRQRTRDRAGTRRLILSRGRGCSRLIADIGLFVCLPVHQAGKTMIML